MEKLLQIKDIVNNFIKEHRKITMRALAALIVIIMEYQQQRESGFIMWNLMMVSHLEYIK